MRSQEVLVNRFVQSLAGILMAGMVRRLGAGTSAIEFSDQEKELRRELVSVTIVDYVPLNPSRTN
jgi:hypothetical protein